MDKHKAQELVAQTGRQLLDMGLVARTWGNISCRTDEAHCVITPSGLDYNAMQAADTVIIDIESGSWQGNHKPSGEKGVHMAAYRQFDDVQFVIHTHQTYATAIGLLGFDELDITAEETEQLGGIALAAYGLPGTKKLTEAVAAKLKEGNHTVLMAHHGALICGSSRDEAIRRAELLEQICRRNIRCDSGSGREAAAKSAELGEPVYAQVDDMAQMIGRRIPVVENTPEAIAKALDKHNAVLVKGAGIRVKADSEDDRQALVMLVEKACICHLHTLNRAKGTRIGVIDVLLMNYVYRHKYSKQKNGDN